MSDEDTRTGAVRTHAVRSIPVRGTIGNQDTYWFWDITSVDVTDAFVKVPEVQPVTVTKMDVTKALVRKFGSARMLAVTQGQAAGYYFISPSYVGTALTYMSTPSFGVNVGNHSEDSAAVTYGQLDKYRILKVLNPMMSEVTHGTCTGAMLTFDGKPVLSMDQDCAVYN